VAENDQPAGPDPGAFLGEFVHSLDTKKRLTVPSEWRARLGDSGRLYVIPGVKEPVLYALPQEDMARRMARLREDSLVDEKAGQFLRIMGSRSELVECDTQGRIRIRDRLLEHAGLSGKVVMVGAIQRIELWNPKAWDEYQVQELSALKDVVGHVGF
jgi:MraZ protein